MRKITTPVRQATEPSVQSESMKSQLGYWTEGEAYEINPQQAADFKEAITKLGVVFNDAMDAATNDPRYAAHFIYTGKKRIDRKIYELARKSWREEKDKGYIIDRWDMAYDGMSPPKLLERNFGNIGLIAGTGSVQEEYIHWLTQQDGFKVTKSFGSLQQAFVSAFRNAAREFGLPANAQVAITVDEPRKDSDPGMLRANEIICRWIKRAGYQPLMLEMFSLHYEDGATQVGLSLPKEMMDSWERKLGNLGRPHDGVGYLVVQQDHCYPFSGFDYYAQTRATNRSLPNKPQALKDIVSELSRRRHSGECRMLQPFWTMMAGHKALLPIMHERHPGHPNLLAASFNSADFTGVKHIVKAARSAQGIGSKIVSEAGEVLSSRHFTRARQTFASHIYQQYADATAEPDGGFRVFHMFTANGVAAALGARVAPGAFVGGDDTKTRFMPVLVRPGRRAAAIAKQALQP